MSRLRANLDRLNDQPLSPGCEGFGESLNKLISSIFSDLKGKPSLKTDGTVLFSKEGKRAVDDLKKILTSNYGNRQWLERQTLIEGDVNAGDFSEALSIGSHAPKSIDDVIKGQATLNKVVTGANTALRQYEKQIKTWDRQALQAAGEDADFTLQRLVDDAKKTPSPAETFRGYGMAVFGGRQLVKGSYQKRPAFEVTESKATKVDALPALDQDGILKAAELIKALLDGKFVEPPVTIGVIVGDGGNAKRDALIDSNVIAEDLYDLIGFDGLLDRFTYPLMQLVDTASLIRALEKWINRSIK